jgi:hypothetical protein
MGLDSAYGIGSLKPGVCTTATRPASPFTGQTIYDTTTATTFVWNGTAWVGTGKLLQIVNYQTGALATGTTVVPFDDTIPQNTEGTEFLTLAITPTSTTTLLQIDITASFSYSINNTVTLALFQDSTANALAASSEYGSTATGMINSSLTYKMTSGTISATTFKLRMGGETAGTLTLNGYGGARKLGGVYVSSINITEYAA